MFPKMSLYSVFTWRHRGRIGGVNIETAAILEEWNILLGIKLYFYANPSFSFIMQIWLLVTWANTLHFFSFCFDEAWAIVILSCFRFNYVGLYIVMITKTIKTVSKVSDWISHGATQRGWQRGDRDPVSRSNFNKIHASRFESVIVGETSGKRSFHDQTQIIHESRITHEINHASLAFRYSRITFLFK